MNEEQLYETLKKYQEPLGYFFNKDKERVFDLLKGLLINKGRYGYMSCPCRLASGDRQKDKDIICPCIYRAPDVEEYGSCYCNLYVSKAWNEGTIPHVYVPERRPPEKMHWTSKKFSLPSNSNFQITVSENNAQQWSCVL